MSDKKNTDQPGDTDRDKKTAGTQGEGFAAKVDRLSGKNPETPAGEGHRSDAPDSKRAHEPVLVTDHPADSQAAPAVTQVIKKRSLAGLLGFLFGATALAGLGYWYYQQNGWQWPPAGSVARVKQADLHALETRLRQEWKSDLKQEIQRIIAQQQAQSQNTETGPETTAAVNEKINTLQARVDSLQQQLASLPTSLPTGEGSSPENGGAINKDTAEQLASLQNRLQQASEQIQALQQALAENRKDTQAQLAQWQQQLETALNQTQSAGQNPLPDPQVAQHLAQQLRLQQALNALDSAQLALNVQHQPRAAAVALEQAAEQLRPVPEAGQQLQAIQQALATLEAQQNRPDTLTPALAESAQAIANWHWQPPNNASDPSAENKKGWLANLVVIKKIDRPEQAALTLAEEERIKRAALDALAAASMARHNGDQAAWQQALDSAINSLQPVAANQPQLAKVVEKLQRLRDQRIAPDWPDLSGIRESLQQRLDETRRTEPDTTGENRAP